MRQKRTLRRCLERAQAQPSPQAAHRHRHGGSHTDGGVPPAQG